MDCYCNFSRKVSWVPNSTLLSFIPVKGYWSCGVSANSITSRFNIICRERRFFRSLIITETDDISFSHYYVRTNNVYRAFVVYSSIKSYNLHKMHFDLIHCTCILSVWLILCLTQPMSSIYISVWDVEYFLNFVSEVNNMCISVTLFILFFTQVCDFL